MINWDLHENYIEFNVSFHMILMGSNHHKTGNRKPKHETTRIFHSKNQDGTW